MSKFEKRFNVNISNDFDIVGALAALEKTNVAVFFISQEWFDDLRAQNEWRHAKNLEKPMIYIFDKTKKYDVENKYLLDAPTLFGTINYYGDMKKTTSLLDILISSLAKAKIIK